MCSYIEELCIQYHFKAVFEYNSKTKNDFLWFAEWCVVKHDIYHTGSTLQYTNFGTMEIQVKIAHIRAFDNEPTCLIDIAQIT